MLKRKAKQFISMLTSLALAATFVLSTAAPASAATNIPLGDSGYVSLHTYTTPTDVENVYKVKLSMDVNTNIPERDIVFVIDNSNSMGVPPEDEYIDATGTMQTLNADLVEWADDHPNPMFKPKYYNNPVTPTPPYLVSDFATLSGDGTKPYLGVYGWAGDPYSEDPMDPGYVDHLGIGRQLYTVGSWRYGEIFDQHWMDTNLDPESYMFANPDTNPTLIAQNGYRFEWMKAGLSEAVEALLNPQTNGAASKNRVAVFGFGDASTSNQGISNTLQMDTMAPWTRWPSWPGPDAGYDWQNAGDVWAIDYHLGNTPTGSPAFSYGDFLTFNSNMVTKGFASVGDVLTDPNACWVGPSGYQQLLDTIDANLVRREEGTGMAAGLAAAYDLLKGSDPDTEKHVFILSDGVETTDRNADDDHEFVESAAIASNLKDIGVQMTGLGILNDQNSLYQFDTFNPSLHTNMLTNNGQPSSLQDYLTTPPSSNGNSKYDGYAGETHLLRTIIPLKDGSVFKNTDYSAINLPTGALPFYSGLSGQVAIEGGNGYDTYVADITAHGDFNNIHYYRANSSRGVSDAFADFVKSLFAASDIEPEITLGAPFTVYQMPGKSLFETVNSSAAGGNRSISWMISDVPAVGGTASVTFYVKVDPTAATENLWQGLFESFIIKYKDFYTTATQKGLPQTYIEVPSPTEAQEIDHRLDDSGVVISTSRKVAEPAFVNSFAAKVNVSVADVSATSPGKGKARLVIDTTAAVNGSETLYYQWQRFNKDKNDWVSIQGANSSVFTVTGLAKGEHTFRCAVRTANSAFTFSKEITVTVK